MLDTPVISSFSRNEEFTPSLRVTQTESGEPGFEHRLLGYQRHALNHSAMLPFNVTGWSVVSVSPDQCSAKGYHTDPISYLPPWLLWVEYMKVIVPMFLASQALNISTDLCKDICQSKPTKYVVFIWNVLMTLGGVGIISILIMCICFLNYSLLSQWRFSSSIVHINY